MTWQTTLALVLYVGWVGLHSWLGKRRLLRTLAVLIGFEVLGFAGLVIWFQAQESHVSAGAAAGMAIILAFAVLLVPAAVGAFSLWKHGTTRAL